MILELAHLVSDAAGMPPITDHACFHRQRASYDALDDFLSVRNADCSRGKVATPHAHGQNGDETRSDTTLKKSFASWALAMAPLVGSLVVFAAPAPAQNYLGGYLQQKQLNDMRMMQQRGIEKRRQQQQQQGGQAQAPSSAQRNLTARQQACAQRYKTYNPQTNTYTVRPGVQAQCRL